MTTIEESPKEQTNEQLVKEEKDSFLKDLSDFTTSLQACQKKIQSYRQEMEGANKIEKDSKKDLRSLSYEIKRLRFVLNKLKNGQVLSKEEYEHFKIDLSNNQSYIRVLGSELPNKTNDFLSFFLGNVTFYITDYTERVKYKTDYEKFKKKMLMIFGISSCLMLLGYTFKTILLLRLISVPYHLVPFYYYLSLTMKETVLKSNGSNITRWWAAHHFLSFFCSGFLLFWPFGSFLKIFASRFYLFSIYMSFTQLFLHNFQVKLLYKLRALGNASIEDTVNYDTPVTHFTSRLRLQLPFTIVQNLIMLYLSFYLIKSFIVIKESPNHCLISGLLLLVLVIGNSVSCVKNILNILKTRSLKKPTNRISNLSWLIAKKMQELQKKSEKAEKDQNNTSSKSEEHVTNDKVQKKDNLNLEKNKKEIIDIKDIDDDEDEGDGENDQDEEIDYNEIDNNTEDEDDSDGDDNDADDSDSG
ncbi:transmembrane protein induced by tumor necrosis factor alpha [Anaeramoeba flamelloides]|uniref:Transmembrane protein induced by tumor necrosis factor alpha n=1 Tax=Anaeramoeba flamelloides TaxID=1746091 RepID=A0AAV8A9N1_9EUKA|nr:transmembrane protein induced by tumor necrosis factor alpha [Anaeramoeba flamelloides]